MAVYREYSGVLALPRATAADLVAAAESGHEGRVSDPNIGRQQGVTGRPFKIQVAPVPVEAHEFILAAFKQIGALYVQFKDMESS